jgi:hypothetical protein
LLSTAFAAATATAVPVAAAQPRLGAYNADIAQTSISGISSGAYMAVQFGTAWSSIIKGVGAIAGGPFGCSEGAASEALSACEGGEPPPEISELIRRTDAWSHGGGLDDTGHIAAQKIYLFHGYNDTVVSRSVSDSLHDFYTHYLGANAGNLFYQTAIGAGHAQVTANYGGKCSVTGGEYINNCRYDQAGVLLQHIYGALNPRNNGALTGQLLSFNQGEFTAPDKANDDSMDDKGFVYVPASCAAHQPCQVHVALHGCKQSVGSIHEDFVRHAGYNEWADTNHLIVLYPQTHVLAVTDRGLTNPESCWDWWGYLDPDPEDAPTYLLKSGKQIHAIKAMVDRLTSGASTSPAPIAFSLAAPTAVLAADRSDTAIDVVWSAAPGADHYDVFRAGPADEDFGPIASVSGTSYADAGLRPGTSYRYKVRASSAAGVGLFSPIASQDTLPPVLPCDDPGSCAVR